MSLKEGVLKMSMRHTTQWAMTLMACLLITSCSHFAKKDGPPRFYVDESRIKDAVPKPEPRSKYGNLDSYTVFGKRYHTLPTSEGYSEVGTASWYGTKFHDRKTSSGEPYDMLKMTAAHKTLPLPTYVRVTNLVNHKEIIVKVNDRGPFASDRIIDLSYVAAKKLGMMGHGTTRVRVTAINPYTYNQTQYATRDNTSHAEYLQVGAFRSKSNAIRLKSRLTSVLNNPIIIQQPQHTHALYYVKVGPFNSERALSLASTQLKKLGISAKPTA